MMKRILLHFTALITLPAFALANDKPNIIVIMADDLGAGGNGPPV